MDPYSLFKPSPKDIYIYTYIYIYIYNQRFWDFMIYSPPARWGLLDFIRAHARHFLLLRLLLLPPPPRLAVLLVAKLFADFQAQCALLDLNRGSSQLSVHRWTSTCELPSSVCTAGPQPGTCPAQCAPLDLNLGPAQLSVHRWTSTVR